MTFFAELLWLQFFLIFHILLFWWKDTSIYFSKWVSDRKNIKNWPTYWVTYTHRSDMLFCLFFACLGQLMEARKSEVKGSFLWKWHFSVPMSLFETEIRQSAFFSSNHVVTICLQNCKITAQLHNYTNCRGSLCMEKLAKIPISACPYRVFSI